MSTMGAAGPMRMGAGAGAGLGGKLKQWREKLVPWLAWASFLLAFASSPLLAGTFVGGFVDNVLTFGPAWVALLALVVIGVGVGVDLIRDGVPNMMAFWGTLLICSVARSVDGRFGDRVEGWANALLGKIREPLSAELGTGSALALALCGAAAAFLVARRTMAAKASGR